MQQIVFDFDFTYLEAYTLSYGRERLRCEYSRTVNPVVTIASFP